jgi:proline iminopeptidase
MKDLYPEVLPYRAEHFSVDQTHTLYVEEVGTSAGIPALFLHGGPGAGCESYHRRFFDPQRYRVILFDQRGAGRSTPHASLQDNTTWDLVEDIEKLRRHLGIDQWLVFGGSWGSTLALAYAETHPERVSALVLRGIFLCRPQEIQWFYQVGANRLFPDYWEDFAAPVAPAQRADMLAAYHRLLTGDDELRRLAAAKAWSVWEGRTATLLPDVNVAAHFARPHVALSMARIECHFFVNDAFLKPDQLLADADRLAGIPGVIVHGRYDVICPLESAWALHAAWSASELSIIADAGHSAAEAGTRRRLIEATDQFADRLGG